MFICSHWIYIYIYILIIKGSPKRFNIGFEIERLIVQLRIYLIFEMQSNPKFELVGHTLQSFGERLRNCCERLWVGSGQALGKPSGKPLGYAFGKTPLGEAFASEHLGNIEGTTRAKV